MTMSQMQLESFQWNSREASAACLSSKCVELFWIRSGAALVRIGQQIQDVKAHHLVSLNNQAGLEILESVRGYHLRVERQLVMTCLPEPLPPPLGYFLQQLTEPCLCLRFSQRGRSEAEWFLHRMLWEDERSTDIAWTSNRLTLAQFILLCYREWITAEHDKEAISASGESVVRLLRDYIDQHFHEHLSLKELSQRAGYAPSYLSSLFSRANGQGLSEYISRKRIGRAQQLLKSSELKVIDICYQVGFKDLAHFNRTFKRYVGIPPNQYRHSSGPGLQETVQMPHSGASHAVLAQGLSALSA